jgi:hypothetical protein
MVYVDPLMNCIPNSNWRWKRSCHLFADTVEELHEFAQRIGMRRAWFQDHKKLPHYDLNESRRAAAVLNGAKEVDRKFIVEFMRMEARSDE